MTRATFTIAAIALVCGTGAAAPVRRETVVRSHDRRNPAAIGKPFDRPAAGLGEEAKVLFLNSTTGREGLKI